MGKLEIAWTKKAKKKIRQNISLIRNEALFFSWGEIIILCLNSSSLNFQFIKIVR